MPCVDCGLGIRHQQSMHDIHKTYVHLGGVVTGSEQAYGEGDGVQSLES
jgi:hypothetical protein